MKNLVGSKNPTPEKVEELLGLLGAMMTQTTDYTVDLTSDERLRTTKFKPGGERIVKLLGDVATQYGVALPGISVEAMNNDLELAQRLEPLASQLASSSQTISDTILQASSECWWAATAYYTALVRMADTDPKLAEALKPAVDFFATGRRKRSTSK